MAPEWWFQMMEQAEGSHEPDCHEGREWDELTPDEHDVVIRERLTDLADNGE